MKLPPPVVGYCQNYDCPDSHPYHYAPGDAQPQYRGPGQVYHLVDAYGATWLVCRECLPEALVLRCNQLETQNHALRDRLQLVIALVEARFKRIETALEENDNFVLPPAPRP